MAIHKAKIVAITSVKGGVGKTFFTLNLAATLQEQKQRQKQKKLHCILKYLLN